MHLAIQGLNEEEKFWYGKLLVAVINADGQVHENEIDFLILAMHFLKGEQQTQLRQMMKLKTELPGLEKIPQGLERDQLLMIYTNLVMVAVADSTLSIKEQTFLNRVRGWFVFNAKLEKSLEQWTSDVFDVVKQRDSLLKSL